MVNKILVEVYIPTIEEKYDIFIPINRTVEMILLLLNKGINEITNGAYLLKKSSMLCNRENGTIYDLNMLIKDTDLKNGSKLLLI